MKLVALLSIFAALAETAPTVVAFVVPKTTVANHHAATTCPNSKQQSSALHAFGDKAKNVLEDWQDVVTNVDVSSITDNLDDIQANIVEGDFGSRGEAYTAAQYALVFCILIGGVPIIGDAAMLLLGPGLLLVGLATMVLSLTELGPALSPWPVPGQRGDLVTDGLYGQMRHPIYAGLLATCAGFSILTGSATRLLLTAILVYAANVKADFEEESLLLKYPDEYPAYQKQVPGKLFPQDILDQMPWMNN